MNLPPPLAFGLILTMAYVEYVFQIPSGSGTFYLIIIHLQGRKIESEEPATAGGGRRYDPPKRRFTQDLHGSSSQKTAFFTFTAVKTSNPT
jgi:hypothetical protein